MYRADRAIADARSVVDLRKDMVELRECQLTRTKSN